MSTGMVAGLPSLFSTPKGIFRLHPFRSQIKCKMSKRQNLLSYFSPVSRTRDSSTGSQRRAMEPGSQQTDSTETRLENKRLKKETEANDKECKPPRIDLSPEQKAKIEIKRQEALARFQQQHGDSTALSQLVGESWYTKLQPEFSKDYFVKVRYLTKSHQVYSAMVVNVSAGRDLKLLGRTHRSYFTFQSLSITMGVYLSCGWTNIP